MAVFMSTVTAKIDAKGRVSIPAAFRAVIAEQNGEVAKTQDVFLYPALAEKAIEGGGLKLQNDSEAILENIPPGSSDHDSLSAVLYGDRHNLTIDADGRVILPADLLTHAEIGKEMCFVGLGNHFRIWNPKNYAEFKARAHEAALEYRNLLSKRERDRS